MIMTMNQENQSMQAVGYARVSSKDQEDTGYSLPAQEKLLRDYADRNGFELVKVFAIQESAAGKIQRKIFHEMMAHVTKTKINTVFVETTDRLTRNFADVSVIDNWILADEAHKIHVIDKEKSPLIKKMFDLYANGKHSTKKLCDVMYEQRFRSSTGHKES